MGDDLVVLEVLEVLEVFAVLAVIGFGFDANTGDGVRKYLEGLDRMGCLGGDVSERLR